jgi:hypothetical protein
MGGLGIRDCVRLERKGVGGEMYIDTVGKWKRIE